MNFLKVHPLKKKIIWKDYLIITYNFGTLDEKPFSV